MDTLNESEKPTPVRAVYPPSSGYEHHEDVSEEERLLLDDTTPGPSSVSMKSSGTSRVKKRAKGSRRSSGLRAFTRTSLICAGTFIVGAAVTLLGIPAMLPATSHHYTGMPKTHDIRLWNGTHTFRKTVLMVSIDGLRADYLDRGLSPHLLNISQQGLRAQFLRPIFPTLTFPNHWALLTGLYAESHGIIANNFYDPVSNTKFDYAHHNTSWNSTWWGGEPVWETASKAGITTANLMWPGPAKTRNGIENTYFVPWRNHVPLQEKHDQIMDWIDMPFETRPQLILAYEPHLDQVGHKAGPGSDLVNSVLLDVDIFAKSIHDSLRTRNLSNIVDVIFVSDHGMTNTSESRLVYLDDILGEEHFSQIEHQDGWPSVGLRLTPAANSSDILHTLLTSAPATSDPPAISIYTSKTMPARYHFNPSHNDRIAPIYVVPRLGWAITTHHEHKVTMGGVYEPIGNHGYDNQEADMHAAFVADGPFATLVKRREAERDARRRQRRNIGLPGVAAALLPRGWVQMFSDEDGDDEASIVRRKAPQVIEGFDNVEIYSLVLQLLGVDVNKWGAPHNGTRGFWDRYLVPDEDED